MWNFCLQASIVNAFILYMATNTDPKPRNFTQSQFRLVLGKQLIGGFSCRKATPITAPLFIGPDVVDTEQIVNHENSRMDSARGRNCKIHKQHFRVTKRWSMVAVHVVFIFVKNVMSNGTSTMLEKKQKN